jgi:hypothetical protein
VPSLHRADAVAGPRSTNRSGKHPQRFLGSQCVLPLVEVVFPTAPPGRGSLSSAFPLWQIGSEICPVQAGWRGAASGARACSYGAGLRAVPRKLARPGRVSEPFRVSPHVRVPASGLCCGSLLARTPVSGPFRKLAVVARSVRDPSRGGLSSVFPSLQIGDAAMSSGHRCGDQCSTRRQCWSPIRRTPHPTIPLPRQLPLPSTDG